MHVLHGFFKGNWIFKKSYLQLSITFLAFTDENKYNDSVMFDNWKMHLFKNYINVFPFTAYFRLIYFLSKEGVAVLMLIFHKGVADKMKKSNLQNLM